jgi:CRISPR-associated protein Cas2
MYAVTANATSHLRRHGEATMHILLIYDITHDGTRTKVARACEDYGLDRLQLSAFAGKLTKQYQRELMSRIKRLMRKKAGVVTLYPIGQDAWDAQIEVRNDDQ